MKSTEQPRLTRRELGALAGAAVLGSLLPVRGQSPQPGPILDIADWSYKFYGVEHALLARGTVCNGMQMYVEHWIPAQVKHPYAIVLIHGGYGQGSDWFSEPDGKRGWATRFLEQGYKVYVVDRPGQGRNPFNPAFNGNFDAQAPTFRTAAAAHGIASETDARVAQIIASMGQPMANNPQT